MCSLLRQPGKLAATYFHLPKAKRSMAERRRIDVGYAAAASGRTGRRKGLVPPPGRAVTGTKSGICEL